MAIQFARIEIVSRSKGGNACCKGAYNARTIIQDELTNIKYDFSKRGDNVYHTILLPNHVSKKFKDPKILMNEVEKSEKRKNSQLLKDIVIALPDDKELTLEDRIAITHEIIEEMAWVKNGLGVQVDIHKPHKGEKNWHAHLLLTTRKFSEDGKNLGAKAVDLNPQFKNTKGGKGFIIPEAEMIHEKAKGIIDRYFEKLGLENRVDAIGAVAQQHIGPVRMRSLINKVVEENELVKDANLKILKEANGLLDHITKYQAIFSKQDVQQAIQKVEDETIQAQVIQQVGNGIIKKLYKQISLNEIEEDEDIFYSLLVFAGYLNPAIADDNAEAPTYHLTIPNKEVRYIYIARVTKWVARKLNIKVSEYDNFINLLLLQQIDKFKEKLQEYLLGSTSYHDLNRERDYHNLMGGILAPLVRKYMIESNRESGHGRCDHILIPIAQAVGTAIIIEYKICTTSEELKSAATDF